MKINKKIFYFGLLFLLWLLVFTTKVQAAGNVSLKTNKTNVTVGDEFNVSVNLSNASVATLTTRITIDTSKVDYISGPANTNFSKGKVIYTWTDPTGGENPKTDGIIATFKFKAKASGSASFSVSGNFYTPDEIALTPSFSGTTVTIKEKENTVPTPNPPPTTTTPTPPITGGTSGGSAQGGTNVGGNINQGENSKPENNNNQTLSSNSNLKELHLNVEGLSPSFQKTITRYNLIIGNDISEILVNAIPEDENAKVSVSGNTNLKIGLNEIRIKVIAQDGKTTKTYLIEVTKTENPELANANLETLALENVTLEPEFNQDITNYNATIQSNIETINILAIPQIEGAKVEITGSENIQFGENIIKINVIAKDGITNKEYIVNLYKTTPEEENKDNVIIEENQILETSNNKINIGKIVFTIVIVSLIAGLIYVLIRKYKMEN